MIEIRDKKDCCGCSACVQRCPRQCISLKEDEEGFLYPEINETQCIDCGLCEKVCPVINEGNVRKPFHVYAAKNKDEHIRIKSSSGGIFTLIAERIIDDGGIVFGARYNDKWEVVHGYTDKKERLSQFRGSKYVQSRIGNSYKDAEYFLKTGRKVLFTGTPCQIKGLKLFLRKDYDNLLTVDFICHGVPSPGVWRSYLKEITQMLNQKKCEVNKSGILANENKTEITSINFRNKKFGWKKYSLVVLKASTEPKDNTVLLSETHQKNPFMRAFVSNMILRPSCYTCKSKGGKSGSDITIADFWGIRNIRPDFDDDKGISAVIINNEKNDFILDGLNNIEKINCKYEDILRYNPSYYTSSYCPKNRIAFMSDEYHTLNEKVKIYCKKKVLSKYVSYVKKILTKTRLKLIHMIWIT